MKETELDRRAARYITWAAYLTFGGIIASFLWIKDCECPEIDEVYWMPPPIDTIRHDKAFVMVRDGNNNYWVWKPKKHEASPKSGGTNR